MRGDFALCHEGPPIQSTAARSLSYAAHLRQCDWRKAGAEAIERADRMREIGDEEGIVVWRRIRQYVYELQRTRPKGAVH